MDFLINKYKKFIKQSHDRYTLPWPGMYLPESLLPGTSPCMRPSKVSFQTHPPDCVPLKISSRTHPPDCVPLKISSQTHPPNCVSLRVFPCHSRIPQYFNDVPRAQIYGSHPPDPELLPWPPVGPLRKNIPETRSVPSPSYPPWRRRRQTAAHGPSHCP